MNLLIRQARDILVCAYHGNLENFIRIYLSPAAALLTEVKRAASETVSYDTLIHDYTLGTLFRVVGGIKLKIKRKEDCVGNSAKRLK